ncbi:MAG: hypothetical protein HY869_08545 [Chloroflexi bacterium]|nr:hypothetical protein [Chloroflexota bacterium]
MLAKLSKALHRNAKGWLVFILFLLDMFFNILVMPMAQALMKFDGGGPGPLDLRFFTPPARMFEIIGQYGEYNRIFYRNFELTGDILYPIVYTLFFSLLISWLFQRGFAPASNMQKWNVLPFGIFVFDLLENLGIVTLLSVYPSTPVIVAVLTTLITMVKWVFAGGSILLILMGLVMAAKNRFRKQA